MQYIRKSLKLMFGLGKEETMDITIVNILIVAITLGMLFVIGNGLVLLAILTLAT